MNWNKLSKRLYATGCKKYNDTHINKHDLSLISQQSSSLSIASRNVQIGSHNTIVRTKEKPLTKTTEKAASAIACYLAFDVHTRFHGINNERNKQAHTLFV